MTIARELEEQTCREVVIASVYTMLERLEERGLVARVDIRSYRRDLVIVFACWMVVVHFLLIAPAISYMVGVGASHPVIPVAAYAVASIAAILLGGSLHRQKARGV